MIKINNLTKIYNIKTPQEIKALEDVSIKIKKGEVVNIIGKSGSGKTTIANILLGIVKPTSGEVTIDDIVVNSKTKKSKLRLITNKLLSSFQYPTHQLFTKTIKEEIMFNTNNDEKRMKELLKEFSFPEDVLDKSPYKLSSGQKRKVILMSLLMQNPEILIFDEATAYLDAKSRKEFIQLIKDINKKYNTTILFISHNLKDASELSNRTILLDDGVIMQDGDTTQVIDDYLKGGNHG